MNTEAAEMILERIANPDLLMNIAVSVLIIAALVAVVGMIFKALRVVCVVVAVVMCLSSAGVLTKAHSALEESLGVEIPMLQMPNVIQTIKNTDLSQIKLDGAEFSAYIQDLIHH